MTGATGSILGVRLLEMLQPTDVETHLVMSGWGTRTLIHETPYSPQQVQATATRHYHIGDQGAVITSGSYLTDGMVIVPCSMSTLAAIATGRGDNLIHRAADVILKEQRKLVLVVREAPLHTIHLQNMLTLSRMGVVIHPPVPSFYICPENLDDVINYMIMRILDQFNIHLPDPRRWDGKMSTGDHTNGTES